METQRVVRSHRDLDVWGAAMELVVRIYGICGELPAQERFELSSQLRRAAVSIPANIAEGCGRDSTREFLHHLAVAYGSLMELETHLEIARRLAYLQPDRAVSLATETARIGRMINGL